jgi:hypothetical protein
MPRRLSVPSEGPRNILGGHIRKMRVKANLQIVDLARALQLKGWSVDPVTLSQIEARTRTLTDIEAQMILEVLGFNLATSPKQ